jgi:hypothetical protein
MTDSGLINLYAQIAVDLGSVLFNEIRHARLDAVPIMDRLITELSEISPDEIRDKFNSDPIVAEVVGAVFEIGVRTSDEEKRRMLAKVAAAALRDDDSATPDELRQFTRTLRDIEPGHVRLLVLISKSFGPAPEAGKDVQRSSRASRNSLEAAWPEAAPMMTPMLQTLAREGLIADPDRNLSGAPLGTFEKWEMDSYGVRFLEFLEAGR